MGLHFGHRRRNAEMRDLQAVRNRFGHAFAGPVAARVPRTEPARHQTEQTLWVSVIAPSKRATSLFACKTRHRCRLRASSTQTPQADSVPSALLTRCGSCSPTRAASSAARPCRTSPSTRSSGSLAAASFRPPVAGPPGPPGPLSAYYQHEGRPHPGSGPDRARRRRRARTGRGVSRPVHRADVPSPGGKL